MKRLLSTLHVTGFAMVLPFAGAFAAEFEVQMLNKGTDGQAWQFEPAYLKVAPGDTVTFLPADKGHNSETIISAVPEGAEPWKGKINEPVTITYTQEGIYAYKCLPHAALGMVGVIQVGDSTANLAAAMDTKLPGKGKARLDELTAQIGG
jgi:pseudoazurin